ncbi:MAG: HAD hydrolase-like protein [Pseudomonadota bacterium]
MYAVFLDLDGTLVDPKPGITAAIRYAMGELGAEDIPEADDLTWCIGPDLRGSFETLLGPGSDVEAALAAYRDHYRGGAMYEADVYDGVGEMFEGLAAMGVEAFVATSKPAEYAAEIVEHFGIHAHIERLFGAELDGRLGDKAQLLAHALTELEPERAIMVGDRSFDILGAHANGLPAIGALWGYAEPNELHMAEADALCASPEEVPATVLELWGLTVD